MASLTEATSLGHPDLSLPDELPFTHITPLGDFDGLTLILDDVIDGSAADGWGVHLTLSEDEALDLARDIQLEVRNLRTTRARREGEAVVRRCHAWRARAQTRVDSERVPTNGS